MFNFILLFLIYLPFQLALNPTEGIDLASIRVIILLLFLLWLARGLKNKKVLIKNNSSTVLIIFFLAFNLISIAVSGNLDWSVRKLLFLFSIFPVYFVFSDIISDKNKMEKAAKVLVWSGSAAAFLGIIQFLLQFLIGLEKTYKIWANFIIWPFLGNNFSEAVLKNSSWLVNISGKTILRATSTFPDPHMLAFFLGILIPLSLGLFLKSKKPLYLFFFTVLFVGDVLTFSRGGYIGLLAGALAMFFSLWKKFGLKYKITLFLAAGMIAGVLLIPGPISTRFISSLHLNEGSNAGRIEMWQRAGEIILDKPLFGTGIGNYPLEIKPDASYRDPIYAHNTYLDVAVETGIANAIIWITLLAGSAFIFIKKAKKEPFFFWLAISLVIFFAHSLVETAIYSPVVLILLLVIISFTNVEE